MAGQVDKRVNFYESDTLVSYKQDYIGSFAHITQECTVDGVIYEPGLYFGGADGWEKLDNGKDFITKEVDNLTNYYTKDDVDVSEGLIIEAISKKQDTISDLETIRSGAAAGSTALQSFTETDPTVPSWAKASTKPSYTKSEVGLGNVDNTSDANKPISTATQTALDLKVDKTYLDDYYTKEEIDKSDIAIVKAISSLSDVANSITKEDVVEYLTNI